MIIQVNTLRGAALNLVVQSMRFAVAIKGKTIAREMADRMNRAPILDYVGNWAIGGPIFEREIQIHEKRDGYFYCATPNRGPWPHVTHGVMPSATGKTLLEAGMRCYVIAHAGSEIDLPDDIYEAMANAGLVEAARPASAQA